MNSLNPECSQHSQACIGPQAYASGLRHASGLRPGIDSHPLVHTAMFSARCSRESSKLSPTSLSLGRGGHWPAARLHLHISLIASQCLHPGPWCRGIPAHLPACHPHVTCCVSPQLGAARGYLAAGVPPHVAVWLCGSVAVWLCGSVLDVVTMVHPYATPSTAHTLRSGGHSCPVHRHLPQAHRICGVTFGPRLEERGRILAWHAGAMCHAGALYHTYAGALYHTYAGALYHTYAHVFMCEQVCIIHMLMCEHVHESLPCRLSAPMGGVTSALIAPSPCGGRKHGL